MRIWATPIRSAGDTFANNKDSCPNFKHFMNGFLNPFFGDTLQSILYIQVRASGRERFIKYVLVRQRGPIM